MNLLSEGVALVIINTVCLGLGLSLSYLFRRHAARAYQVLLLLILAAVLIPALGIIVHYQNWGLLTESSLESFIHIPQATSAKVQVPKSIIQTESSQEQNNGITAVSPTPRSTETEFAGYTINWASALCVLWMLVTIGLLTRLLIAFYRGRTLLRRAACLHDESLQNTLNNVRQQLNLSNHVRLYSSDRITCPMIWCWATDIAIVVPKTFLKIKGSIDWSGIFCHELAHYKRKDHIHGLLAEFMVCLLPWQPLMWWAKRRLVVLSESACDDWVVSCGHQEADYAESLLDMLPQRRMAFTPTIATHKSNLAIRVRRILARKCSNPRMGVIWSCTAMLITLVGTLGIAFAQTRTVQAKQAAVSTDCRFCQNEKYGFYEEAIHGTVIDTKGNPVEEALVTILPMTGFPGETEQSGHFHEIPYSPAWAKNGVLTLIARHKKTNTATILETPLPVTEVTLKLQPAFKVTGQVFDTDGQPIGGARAMILMKSQFDCPTPIALETTNQYKQSKFTIPAIPFGLDYVFRLEANGYQTVILPLHQQSLIKNELDLGKIALKPQETPIKSKDTTWQEAFNQVYRLENDEIIKFVKAPYILERQNFCLKDFWGKNRFDPSVEFRFIHYTFSWNGQLQDSGGYGWDAWPVVDVPALALQIEPYEYEMPNWIHPQRWYLPHGDWIYRSGASTEDKLKALEPIIAEELNRHVRFEKQIKPRDTIIVAGEFKFQPLPDAPEPNTIFLLASKDDFRDYEDEIAVTVGDFVTRLGEHMIMPIIDETDPSQVKSICYKPTLIWWHGYGDQFSEQRKEEMDFMLQSLSRQTGLQFTIEPRPTEVWVMTEQSD